MRATALHSVHAALGARVVPFAGWSMPVQYSGILDEARCVRGKAGLFDLGHMGRVRVRGKNALEFLQRLQTNDAAKIKPGAIRYAMLLNEGGTVEDDILLYNEPTGDGWFIVVNAANTDKDLAIMRDVAKGFDDVAIEDCTDALGMIAIQGPKAVAIMQRITSLDLGEMKYYTWVNAEIAGAPMQISRTGYTGEDGFEVYCPQDQTVAVWKGLMDSGVQDGLEPIGLAARDTLRLEAGMALYGHEIDDTIQPLEAGLSWAVKFTHDFVGRASLEAIKEQGGSGRKLVGLVSDSRRVPRQGYTLHTPSGDEIGFVCSGTQSPTLDTHIATAFVAKEHAAADTELTFDIRGKREPARVVRLPFYKRDQK